MEKTEKKDNNIKCCIIFAGFAFLCNLISFVSPYWIVGKEGIQKEFVRLGLWVACFDGYIHPEDYVSKKYYGCWYVYWPEYDYIRDWLNPPWFYGVQMMASLSLLCNGLAVIVIIPKVIKPSALRDLKTNVLAMLVQLVAVCAQIVVIVSMGVMSKDRNWMPRPDHNYLSWSFGFAVVASFFTIFSFFNLIIHFLLYTMAPRYKNLAKKYNQVPLTEIGGSTINKSHAGSSSGMYAGNQGGSNIYSQGGNKPNIGTTSGATASAKVREAMSQKQKYGGSAASLNSLGQMRAKTGSTHSLASMGRPPPPAAARGSISSLHSTARSARNENMSPEGSIV